MTKLEINLELTKSAILSLRPTGEAGFEGLLRVILTNLTGNVFRLSASGLQGGIDGDTALGGDSISFEAKRYSGSIHRNEVITKISDLARKNTHADRLWVLGATSEISTQLAEDIEKDGNKNSISTLVLDWTHHPLPILGVALVSAGNAAIEFIINNLDSKSDQKKLNAEVLSKAFIEILNHKEFSNTLESLKSRLNVSKLSLNRAVDLNNEWRQKTFGSKNQSRERLGQTLNVLQDKTFPSIRKDLRCQIENALKTNNSIILLGDEGHGKSWISAQLCCDSIGLSIFISAEKLDGINIDDLDDFLIDVIIRQTGDVHDEFIKKRWRHRFKSWKITPPITSLLIIIDGINQRQNQRWDRILNVFQSRLAEIGGRMIVTVRPTLWRKVISIGLTFEPITINIPKWSVLERDELLKYYAISLEWLDHKAKETLRNPRLLSVAIATVSHNDSIAWKGLTTERLLMEHLRSSQRENYEPESFKVLCKRLSEHATIVLERVNSSSKEAPNNFQENSNAVIETRFFRPIAGPGDLYELREEGLTLALGFTLVDQLWKAHSEKDDLMERITQLIEPIDALDRTADVIFASLLICSLDHIRFDSVIFSVLLDAFSNLQNIKDERFEEFVGIVKQQPRILFNILESFSLETGKRINHDWLVHSAFIIAATPAGWPIAEAAIHDWLRYYNKDPISQTNHYYQQNHQDFETQSKKRKDEIDEALNSLSVFELKLLEQMTELSKNPDELFYLALRLLAGRPLAGFADSFVMLGLSFGLDKTLHNARKAFEQLSTFNRVDRAISKEAFKKAIEPLRTKETSPIGQWTVIRMLHATGDKDDANEAISLADNLKNVMHYFEPPSLDEWRQVRVANPDAIRPVDIDVGVNHFISINPDRLLQSMNVRREDYDFQEFLPIACRFEPEVAFEKVQGLISGVLTREGFPLRQVILNSEDHLPLIDHEFAKKILKKLMHSDDFDSISIDDQSVCRMFAFYYAAGQLSAPEQLHCLTSKSIGEDYLLAVIPSLKLQCTEVIIRTLQDALNHNDENSAFGALTAALYGQAQINGKLEELILLCSQGVSSKLRAVSYQLSIINGLISVRQAHVHSNWKSAALVNNHTYEAWYGSVLLVEACKSDEISVSTLFERVSPETWFVAIESLGIAPTQEFARTFVDSIKTGVQAAQKQPVPPADFEFSRHELTPFYHLSVEEADRQSGRFKKQLDINDFLSGVDDYKDKHKKLNAIAQSFIAELKDSEMRFLIQVVTIENLRHIVSGIPELLNEIVGILQQADNIQFVWLRNLALAVANLVSEKSPETAVVLLSRAVASPGFVKDALGDGLTIEHQAIWASTASQPIEKLWLQRILSSENDEILAKEVLAAERFGAATFIKSTILKFAASSDPLDQAYAITIAGYSIKPHDFETLIKAHVSSLGLTGVAAKHALTEHNNALWAQHWVEKMWNAETAKEFWRCLIIAKTVIDARVNSIPPVSSRWGLYGPVFRRARKAAIKERTKERIKRLIGHKAPETLFINGN